MGGVVMTDETRQELSERQKAYWKKNTALIRNLLIIWALVSYVAAIFLANPLSGVYFFGLPLSFWFAQQGSILVFIALIFYYAIKMDRLDAEFGVQEVILTKKNDGKGGSS
jgi:putative solute:sodium symporter small subunit